MLTATVRTLLKRQREMACRDALTALLNRRAFHVESAMGDFPAMLDAADALMYEIKKECKHGIRTRRFASLPARGRPAKDPR